MCTNSYCSLRTITHDALYIQAVWYQSSLLLVLPTHTYWQQLHMMPSTFRLFDINHHCFWCFLHILTDNNYTWCPLHSGCLISIIIASGASFTYLLTTITHDALYIQAVWYQSSLLLVLPTHTYWQQLHMMPSTFRLFDINHHCFWCFLHILTDNNYTWCPLHSGCLISIIIASGASCTYLLTTITHDALYIQVVWYQSSLLLVLPAHTRTITHDAVYIQAVWYQSSLLLVLPTHTYREQLHMMPSTFRLFDINHHCFWCFLHILTENNYTWCPLHSGCLISIIIASGASYTYWEQLHMMPSTFRLFDINHWSLLLVLPTYTYREQLHMMPSTFRLFDINHHCFWCFLHMLTENNYTWCPLHSGCLISIIIASGASYTYLLTTITHDALYIQAVWYQSSLLLVLPTHTYWEQLHMMPSTFRLFDINHHCFWCFLHILTENNYTWCPLHSGCLISIIIASGASYIYLPTS